MDRLKDLEKFADEIALRVATRRMSTASIVELASPH